MEMERPDEALVHPSQDGIDDAIVGGVGRYIELINPPHHLDDIRHKSKTGKALLRLDEERFIHIRQSCAKLFQAVHPRRQLALVVFAVKPAALLLLP